MTNELLEIVGKEEGQTFKVKFSFVFSRSVCRSRVHPSMGGLTPSSEQFCKDLICQTDVNTTIVTGIDFYVFKKAMLANLCLCVSVGYNS